MMIARMIQILRRRSPVELAVMIADRIARPTGLSIISYTQFGPCRPSRGDTPQQIFDNAALDNRWGSAESISGEGSEIARTAHYRGELLKLLPRFGSMSTRHAAT